MEGQFLVRQIYDDEITYNLISAAVNRLSKYIYSSICIKRPQREMMRFKLNDCERQLILRKC